MSKNKAKRYRAPRLVNYGDVYDLTQAKGGHANDSTIHIKPKTKSHGAST